MGAACRALDIPITGGNVSLYNETDGRAVLPTPVLGVVGLIEDAERVVRRTFQASGDAVVLLGDSRAELGGSEYLKTVHGLMRGVPPALDLDARSGAAAAAGRRRRGRSDPLGARLRRGRFGGHPGRVLLRYAARRRCRTCAAVAARRPPFGDVATLFGESASRVDRVGVPRAGCRICCRWPRPPVFRRRRSARSAATASASAIDGRHGPRRVARRSRADLVDRRRALLRACARYCMKPYTKDSRAQVSATRGAVRRPEPANAR